MGAAYDWRHLFLLLAANERAGAEVSEKGTRAVKHSMRFALYMLVAFSLRRRGLGLTRRDMRQSKLNPSPVRSSQMRFGFAGAAHRLRMLANIGARITTLPLKQSCPSIAYR